MKIAVNIQPLLHIGKSGIGFYQHELMTSLLDIDKDNRYYLDYFDLTGKKKMMADKYSADNAAVKCCRFFNATIYNIIWSVIPLPYRWFFPEKTDISLFFNYYLPPHTHGKTALVVYDTVIDDFPETVRFRTKALLRLNMRQSIKRADRIITISEFSKAQIMKHYGVKPEKITIIPCAVNRSKYFPPADKGEAFKKIAKKYGIGGKYYLYLGNLEPRKNITRLVEAYAEALKKRDDLPLLVLAGGKGWLYDSIFERVRELELGEKVVFTGYVDDDDVPLMMGCAEAFCFPSLYEGFGMPPLEAMACGTPVIVSDTSSLPEVVGDCGIRVDPESTEEIADALIKILDVELAHRQSAMGIERANYFSWKKNAELLLGVFEELTNEKA